MMYFPRKRMQRTEERPKIKQLVIAYIVLGFATRVLSWWMVWDQEKQTFFLVEKQYWQTDCFLLNRFWRGKIVVFETWENLQKWRENAIKKRGRPCLYFVCVAAAERENCHRVVCLAARTNAAATFLVSLSGIKLDAVVVDWMFAFTSFKGERKDYAVSF